MIQAHSLAVQRTAHYYTLGHPGPLVRYLILACHGYGQLAQNFIRKFDQVAAPDVWVVAPEGLSRFYWQGLDGAVAASWMTREDRLAEIADYCGYLTQLYARCREQCPPAVQVLLVGFSQGCATQLRWIMQEEPHFDYLGLWGGMLPEDLDFQAKSHLWRAGAFDFFYGDADSFITPELMERFTTFFEQHQLPVQTHQFKGGHTLDRASLAQWLGRIRAAVGG